MNEFVHLVGAEAVTAASHRMAEAANAMQAAADSMAFTMQRRREWEEEYLARIEAIVREELDFYAKPVTSEIPR